MKWKFKNIMNSWTINFNPSACELATCQELKFKETIRKTLRGTRVQSKVFAELVLDLYL